MYSCKITDKNKCISNFNYMVNKPKELIQSVDTILPYTSMQKGAINIDVTGGFGQYFSIGQDRMVTRQVVKIFLI